MSDTETQPTEPLVNIFIFGGKKLLISAKYCMYMLDCFSHCKTTLCQTISDIEDGI